MRGRLAASTSERRQSPAPSSRSQISPTGTTTLTSYSYISEPRLAVALAAPVLSFPATTLEARPDLRRLPPTTKTALTALLLTTLSLEPRRPHCMTSTCPH